MMGQRIFLIVVVDDAGRGGGMFWSLRELCLQIGNPCLSFPVRRIHSNHSLARMMVTGVISDLE